MLRDFRTFILRGNVVDMAVGIAIGAAFSAVVSAVVKDLITPLTAVFGGTPDFSTRVLVVGHAHILYGDFLNAVISFLILAFSVYFLVVHPINLLMSRRKTETATAATTKDCDHCLSAIPARATVCAFCTRDVAAAA